MIACCCVGGYESLCAVKFLEYLCELSISFWGNALLDGISKDLFYGVGFEEPKIKWIWSVVGYTLSIACEFLS